MAISLPLFFIFSMEICSAGFSMFELQLRVKKTSANKRNIIVLNDFLFLKLSLDNSEI